MNLRRWFKSRTDGTNFLTLDTGSLLCAYSFTQAVASDEWIINHNNNSIVIAIQVFINNELVEPDEIIINNTNTFTIKFSTAVSGVVNFLVFKIGSNLQCVELTPTPSASVTPTPPTISVTQTPATTPGATPTPTQTVTPTSTAEVTPTTTATMTPAITISATPAVTSTPEATPTPTATPAASSVSGLDVEITIAFFNTRFYGFENSLGQGSASTIDLNGEDLKGFYYDDILNFWVLDIVGSQPQNLFNEVEVEYNPGVTIVLEFADATHDDLGSRTLWQWGGGTDAQSWIDDVGNTRTITFR